MITCRVCDDPVAREPAAALMHEWEAHSMQGGDEWCAVALDLVGLCGCGFPERVAPRLRDLMRVMHPDASWDDRYIRLTAAIGGDEATAQLMLHLMETKDWVEHGSGVMGSWLTDTGLDVLAVMEEACRRDGVA